MTETTVRLTNGQRWTAQQFVSHYLKRDPSGKPPAAVDVDRSWYMDDGPGRYYHPGMFPIINQIADNRNLGPGTYDLAALAKNDDDLKARISHYKTDLSSADHRLRALVFGNESAKIVGQVAVNQDGSKMFKQVEIRPFDTNFDFEHNTLNLPLEIFRYIAKKNYDPEKRGVSYGIQYRGPGPNFGNGRIYDPFTESQLNSALRREFVYPHSAPPWLLSSVTGKPPVPFADEYRQYLEQASGDDTHGPGWSAGAPASRSISPANQILSGSGIASWVAGLAGVDAANPMQPAPQPADKLRGLVSNQPMPDWPFPPPIFNTR
jgi:hypothetical protein